MISRELPRAVYSAAQCKALDRRAIETLGIPGYALMQRAAQASLALIRQRWPQVRSLSIWVGGGNNGGDGVVLARLADELGWPVQLVFADASVRERATQEAASAWGDLPNSIKTQIFTEGLAFDADLIVDALLGIGLRGEVREPTASMIATINASQLPVLALDQPSGLDTDLGIPLGAAVRADITLTFIANKLGWLTAEGSAYSGERYWASLGIPQSLFETVEPFAYLTQEQCVRSQLPRRTRSAHKGNFGVVTILGGNLGMGGAVILAAEAALRAGAGRVVLLTRPAHVVASLARVPEVMVHGVETPSDYAQFVEQSSALVVGPGLGQDSWAQGMLALAESFDGPRVFDADALNLLVKGNLWVGAHTVCTPHPGEAARLLGISARDVQHDRVAAVLNLARKYGGVQVLKGPGTLTCAQGQIEVCGLGNAGMATAGMGDILSGIIGALLAQGLTLADAARCGVWIHARAGDLAAARGERGLLASDLLAQIRVAVNDNEIDIGV